MRVRLATTGDDLASELRGGLAWTHAAERVVVDDYLLAIDHTEARLLELDARLAETADQTPSRHSAQAASGFSHLRPGHLAKSPSVLASGRLVVYNLIVMERHGYAQAAAGRLDATFAALADPTRRAILARLCQGEASVTELAEPFDISQPAVSKHLKVLERAGLVVRGRDAQRRPVRVDVTPLTEVSAWLDDYRRALDANFSRLDTLLQSLKKAPRPGRGVSAPRPAHNRAHRTRKDH